MLRARAGAAGRGYELHHSSPPLPVSSTMRTYTEPCQSAPPDPRLPPLRHRRLPSQPRRRQTPRRGGPGLPSPRGAARRPLLLPRPHLHQRRRRPLLLRGSRRRRPSGPSTSSMSTPRRSRRPRRWQGSSSLPPPPCQRSPRQRRSRGAAGGCRWRYDRSWMARAPPLRRRPRLRSEPHSPPLQEGASLCRSARPAAAAALEAGRGRRGAQRPRCTPRPTPPLPRHTCS